MKMLLHTLLLVLALAEMCLPSNSQTDPFSEVVRCKSISMDLANTLARVAWLSHLPMTAELAQPLPRIEIPEGAYVVKDLLHEVVRQTHGYQWQADGKVIHFYNKELSEAKFNFLSWRLSRFVMPGNLSELKLIFPNREFGLLQGYYGSGFMITGFGDEMLASDLLKPTTFEDFTGREILVRAANESSTFFSVLVFPNAHPTKKQMERDMNRNWFWQALKEQPGPLYVQPPASTGRQ